MDDLISRQAAIEAIASRDETNGTVKVFTGRQVNEILESLPSAEAEDRLYIKIYADDAPSVMAEKLYQICDETQNGEVAEWLKEYFSSAEPERKKGKWTEKHHAYSDEESVIEEWQSCRCSECGRYDTRPYMYYFSEPNYCSYCGARMKGETDGRPNQQTSGN